MKYPKTPRLKLSSAKYRKLCEYIFERDQFCLFCGRHDQSTPAHIVRRSQGGNDSANNIIRACVRCHTKFDKYEIELPESVRLMLEGEADIL